MLTISSHFTVGTAWYGRSGRDETLITAVKTALAAGYTHLDGAVSPCRSRIAPLAELRCHRPQEMYANSESLGFAIADVPRESYYRKSTAWRLRECGPTC